MHFRIERIQNPSVIVSSENLTRRVIEGFVSPRVVILDDIMKDYVQSNTV